jgi:hypothetical protein
MRRLPRAAIVVALTAAGVAVLAQAAAADPTNAPRNQPLIAVCDGEQLLFSVNSSGQYTPGHDTASTRVFVPTAFDLTFTITPISGPTIVQTDTALKKGQPSDPVVCVLPGALNTFAVPDGTVTLSGSITGFFTPAY